MTKNKDLTEYILFADETNKTPKNPYFCFAGLIIKSWLIKISSEVISPIIILNLPILI